MFTHARCGGTLIPIADPPWFIRQPVGADWTRRAVFARCDRCGLPGEVVEEPSPVVLEEGS